MFRATISIDLPNEPRAHDAFVLRWLSRVFLGGEGPKQRIAGEALGVLRDVVHALVASGFTTALSLSARNKPAFVDRVGESDDLLPALEAALANEQFRRPPIEVQVVAAREDASLHTVTELSLREQVLVGERELRLTLSTRIREARVNKDESPIEYRLRVREYLAAGGFARAHASATAVAQTLADALDRTISANDVRVDFAAPRVVVPGPLQVGRFRLLGFHDRCRAPAYSPVRRRSRRGAYDDPQVYYYYDPYHDLLSWLLVEAMLDGHWQPQDVEVVAVDGSTIASGAARLDGEQLDVPLDAVRLRKDAIEVDSSVPPVHQLDDAEAGSPYAPGYGGGNEGN